MGHGAKRREEARTPVAQRVVPRAGVGMLSGLRRDNVPRELLAGVTLLAIAIPEQLATSQLADVPAYLALIAFMTATVVFSVFGSNPIMSVGADSTIAPLFTVALLRLALPASPAYLSLVAATAVVTGLLVAAVGLLRLGWLGDFLSVPIVTGFMSGIGVIIIVHQLPHVLGVSGGGESIASRLRAVFDQLAHVNAWSLVIALGTLAIMLVGERINGRLPSALVAVVGFTIVSAAASLPTHGVQVLGTVAASLPAWRLHWFSAHQWGAVVTTSLTLMVVIISQSAATSRVSADEIGVAEDLNHDFVGVGLANVAVGLFGSFPVDASPARTTVTRMAGGRTKLAGLVAALGALVLSPLASLAHNIPLSALAGVLLFVASRIIKLRQFADIARTSRTEFVVGVVSLLGVIILGVELGLAIAVGLAILMHTWHSSRPRMIELGRRKGTTSWEPLELHAVERQHHVVAVLFEDSLYFANAGVFRRDVHDLLAHQPDTKRLIIDADAMSDLDYTGLGALDEVVADLAKDGVSVSIARANATVRARLARSSEKALRHLELYDSVDEAARGPRSRGRG